MKNKFKTFALKDRTEFIGLIDGNVFTALLPIMILNETAELEDCLKHMCFKNENDKIYFINSSDLITFELKEIKTK